VLAVFVRDHSSYFPVVAARSDVVRSDLPGTMAASLLPVVVIIMSSNVALNNDDRDDNGLSRQIRSSYMNKINKHTIRLQY
jgi:hypothetical protein